MGTPVIVDLFEWMPPYGENSVAVVISDDTVKLEISFDETNNASTKTLSFGRTRYFSKGSFPGVGRVELTHPYKLDEFRSGSVIEIEDSTLAREWNEFCDDNGLANEGLRHFILFLTETGSVFHFVSEGVSVS